MTTSHLYQVLVTELEAVLPPRVVSRALKEGLAQVQRDASTVRVADLEHVLKGEVFRHLQVVMPPEQARETVASMLQRLARADARPEAVAATPPPHEGAGEVPRAHAVPAAGMPPPLRPGPAQERLQALWSALRPFNLYFDWPEVRKLRALAHVLEGETASGSVTATAFDEADLQLRLVDQKLEDHLVIQARELVELEEALQAVQSLGGVRVRRLEALVAQVRLSQANRALAEAEVERARKLAHDLRRLVESQVFRTGDASGGGDGDDRAAQGRSPAGADVAVTDAGDDDDPDRAALTPEATERILRLDVEAETKELADLAAVHAELLRHAPSLQGRFGGLEERLRAGVSIAGELPGLRASLAAETQTQRTRLQAELDAIDRDHARLAVGAEASSLARTLRVMRDILAESLPSHGDMEALRDLHRHTVDRAADLARQGEEARSRGAALLRAQADVLERLDAALARHAASGAVASEALDRLRDARETLARATEARRVDPEALEHARRTEGAWERAVADAASDEIERGRARLRALDAQLSAFPDLGGVTARAAGLRDVAARLAGQDDLEQDQVGAFAAAVEGLHADALDEAARAVDELGRTVGDAVGAEVLRELQTAAREVAAGRFPDLGRVRAAIDDARSSARIRDESRLQRLQGEAARLAASGVPAVADLEAALLEARAAIDAGRSAARALGSAEAAVAAITAALRDRLATFETRLDDALARLALVERLNTDEVAAARRTLTHLDSQRGALARVSPGLQHQLLGALGEAESLLDALAEAYEATRAIADQLVSSSVLDDVLGFFDLMEEPAGSPSASPPAAASPPAETPRAVVDLVDSYRARDDVEAVTVLGGGGHTPLAEGDRPAADGATVGGALAAALAAWNDLGGVLGTGAADVVVIDLGQLRALAAPLTADTHVLVVVSGDAAAWSARLREDRLALVHHVP
jgi:chromosome segregation protein